MFKTGTVLKLKEPREPSQKTDNYTGEPVFEKKRDRTGKPVLEGGEPVFTEKPIMLEFPYNEIEVVGPSPITYGGADSPWRGADAQGVIIKPRTDFAGNLDEPLGKIKQLYDVVSVPEDVMPVERTIKVVDSATAQAGATPEEVFATEAPGKPAAKGLKRGRTSPFDDVEPPKGTQGSSPL